MLSQQLQFRADDRPSVQGPATGCSVDSILRIVRHPPRALAADGKIGKCYATRDRSPGFALRSHHVTRTSNAPSDMRTSRGPCRNVCPDQDGTCRAIQALLALCWPSSTYAISRTSKPPWDPPG